MSVNLDCLSIDGQDLIVWWRDHSRGVNCARALFPDRPKGYVHATRDLANYASNKGTAMLCRSRGDISGAQSYEAICNRIYSQLPAYARW